MADPATYRPATGEIPAKPGVYRFRDDEGRVVYVGKAKSLRSRLSSYFQDVSALHLRTQQMVTTAASVEWTVVDTEVEALQLEYTWIKEFDPRFNVKYRDDKSYPWLAVTVGEEVPRVQVMRGAQKKGVRYFGPYSHAWAIRDTVDSLLRVFPMRSCSAGVYKRAQASGRPCLLGDIGKCAAPCVGRVSIDEHQEIVNDFLAFMAGNTAGFTRDLERRMRDAARDERYEQAAKYRDDLAALHRVLEKQTVVLRDGTDADVFGFDDNGIEVAVQIFSIRDGRIRGQRGWIADRAIIEGGNADIGDGGLAEYVQRAIMTLYAETSADAVPPVVLVPELPADADAVAQLLAEHRGRPVSIRVPKRGDKRRLLETVEQNAREAMARHKLKRASDLNARSEALEELRRALGLDIAPLRIECYDISNLQSTEIVASMVVFEDGLPRKSEYRRFTIRQAGQSDVAAMNQVIRRRLERLLRANDPERDEPDAESDSLQSRKFAYRPSLIVVDGGPTQVAAAKRAFDDLGVSNIGPRGIALCGLAKRLEEIWLPDASEPVVLPRSSEALYLMQRVRDEAHRFANTHHRERRGRAMTVSALDGIAGLGPTRRKALMKQFGSVKKLRAASIDEVAKVPGIGRATAESIVSQLARARPEPAINMTTGEIVEEE